MFLQQIFHQPFQLRSAAGATSEPESDAGAGDSLEDAVQDGREYARESLSKELKRDPTEDEINEWLRQQTEGY